MVCLMRNDWTDEFPLRIHAIIFYGIKASYECKKCDIMIQKQDAEE